jgi:hypothetical protein
VESVVLAIIGSGAFAAAVSAVIVQRQGTVERKRKACAEALTDALEWLELPYRIRRRLDDTSTTLALLRDHINALQARLAFHDSWLLVELPDAHARYRQLVNSIKGATHEAIFGAWKAEPITRAEQMNTGALFDGNFDEQVAEFAAVVRSALKFWRFWQ